jgi:citrate synthase
MHAMRTLVSSLGLDDPSPNVIDIPSIRERALTILALVPTMLAAFHRHRRASR